MAKETTIYQKCAIIGHSQYELHQWENNIFQSAIKGFKIKIVAKFKGEDQHPYL